MSNRETRTAYGDLMRYADEHSIRIGIEVGTNLMKTKHGEAFRALTALLAERDNKPRLREQIVYSIDNAATKLLARLRAVK